MEAQSPWPRPVPVVGDTTSAAERSADPSGWAMPRADIDALARIMKARRDIRRFRPDPVPDAVLDRLLEAAHQAPSVGHSQPWRMIVVTDPQTRARAALMADRSRIQQAAQMEEEAGRHLLDLDLEGIREAPLGIVFCCDRRTPAAGVLGRATFPDADMWSCACAIENLWLAARAEGLGVGWVTLFDPRELAALVGTPEGVSTLGWLCVGWPDERPPSPGLERRGWSVRQPLEEVVIRERWPAASGPASPASRLAPPPQSAVVSAHDRGDDLLTPPGSLGVLDRAVDRLLAVAPGGFDRGALVLAASDHPVARLGVSAYPVSVTRTVAEASVRGVSVGAVSAAQAGLSLTVVDAGVLGDPIEGARDMRPCRPTGDLAHADGLCPDDVLRLVEGGGALGAELVAGGAQLVALGEVGVANTTVAAALGSALLRSDPTALVGLGAGSDSAIVAAKREVVAAAVARAGEGDAIQLLGRLGGGEMAVLAGVVLGVAGAGGMVVLDGMATGVAALAAVGMEPSAAAHLIAGQRSREPGHPAVLTALGLEPLLDLRLRAGEGVGAALAVNLLRAAVAVRLYSARTVPGSTGREA
ncbi:MAG TPA: 5,6-dimethylbenzimidazole synthase [Acidimicrobiales bacterium]|nr:5,6-dimethylbenzimidazole synthase [Acidimicrobiales bacterium]